MQKLQYKIHFNRARHTTLSAPLQCTICIDSTSKASPCHMVCHYQLLKSTMTVRRLMTLLRFSKVQEGFIRSTK